MSSLYLGQVDTLKNRYEIHAFTKNTGYRDYTPSQIADSSLYETLLKERYHLLESGRPIYCTGITPIPELKIETNPHDDREGTIHIVALNKEKNIECAISIATDLGKTDNGTIIGLPLENRWHNMPGIGGIDLMPFRNKYIRTNYNEDRDIQPWEMAELYRHFRTNKDGELASRLAIYIGLYHLCVNHPRKNGQIPTWLFVFDAIPKYFNLYKLASGAIFRSKTIQTPSQFIAPGPDDLEVKNTNKVDSIYFKGEIVSRNLAVPIPKWTDDKLEFIYEDVSFLDGVVDVRRMERTVSAHPIIPPFRRRNGYTISDILKMRIGLAATMYPFFNEESNQLNTITSIINKLSLSTLGIKKIKLI